MFEAMLIERKRQLLADEYERWLSLNSVRRSDLVRMREVSETLQLRPTISVVMATYETPEAFLREAIESVRTQAYPYWELCIADDASKAPHVRKVLEEYSRARCARQSGLSR